MKYRKLRIAWSVACGVLCLLLIGLWARSYYVADTISGDVNSGHFSLGSFSGRIGLNTSPLPYGIDLHHSSFEVGRWIARPEKVEGSGFFANWEPLGSVVTIPHWFLVATFGVVATLPWLPWRFSLRTLLIGMTVVAVFLGLAVMMSRLS